MLGKTVIINKMIKSIYRGQEGIVIERSDGDLYNIYFPDFNNYHLFNSNHFSLKENIIVSSWVYYCNVPLVRIEHSKYVLYENIKQWYADTYGFDYFALKIVHEPACVKCPL